MVLFVLVTHSRSLKRPSEPTLAATQSPAFFATVSSGSDPQLSSSSSSYPPPLHSLPQPWSPLIPHYPSSSSPAPTFYAYTTPPSVQPLPAAPIAILTTASPSPSTLSSLIAATTSCCKTPFSYISDSSKFPQIGPRPPRSCRTTTFSGTSSTPVFRSCSKNQIRLDTETV